MNASRPTDDPRSDAELIEAINDGDLAAFSAIYYRYRDWVVRLARRFVREDEALDVLQETFAYFHRKFPGFTLTARLTTFLYPVVRNLSLRLRERHGRFLADHEVLDTVPAPAPAHSDESDLASVLSVLPPLHRETLLMRFVDDMALDEIAQALHVPLGTIKSRLHNALEMLRHDPRMRSYFQAP